VRIFCGYDDVHSHVEVGQNTSTTALQVIEGDEKGTQCHPVTGGQRSSPPGWMLDRRPTTLLCKKITVAKSKEVKTGCNLAESSKEGYGFKRTTLPMMMLMYSLSTMYIHCVRFFLSY
jgi:hypothetical protein